MLIPIPGLPASAMEVSSQSKVFLKSAHGTFMCAEPGGRVVANRRTPAAWETMTLQVVGSEPSCLAPVVEFRTHHVTSLRVPRQRPLLGGMLSFFTKEDDTDSIFIVEVHGDHVAFRSRAGKYVCAEDNGVVVVDRDKVGPWELFTVILVEEANKRTRFFAPEEPVSIRVFQTVIGTPDAFKEKQPIAFRAKSSSTAQAADVTVVVDDTRLRQRVDGFGAMLSSKAAKLLQGLGEAHRSVVLDQLFMPSQGASLGLLRVSIGGEAYEPDDSAGGGDWVLRQWSLGTAAGLTLEMEDATIAPLLQAALARNPGLELVATPSAPPEWLVGSTGGLADDKVPAYAAYLLEYVDACKMRGTPVAALALSSKGVGQPDQDILALALGPALKQRGVRLHACGHVGAGAHVVSTAEGVEWTDPSRALATYRMYGNAQHVVDSASSLARTRGQFVGTVGRTLDMAASGCSTATLCGVVEDNSAAMPVFEANVNGVLRGLFSIEGGGRPPQPTEAFYAIAHTSRFVSRGARVASAAVHGSSEVRSAAYRNEDGSVVVVLLNTASMGRFVTLDWTGAVADVALPGYACVTVVF